MIMPRFAADSARIDVNAKAVFPAHRDMFSIEILARRIRIEKSIPLFKEVLDYLEPVPLHCAGTLPTSAGIRACQKPRLMLDQPCDPMGISPPFKLKYCSGLNSMENLEAAI